MGLYPRPVQTGMEGSIEMNKIGLKFLLNGGNFFQVIMEQKDVKDVIKKYQQSILPHIIGDGENWAIKTEMIQGIHIIEIEPAKPPQAPMWQGPFDPRKSGYG